MQITLKKIKETKNCVLYANESVMKGGVYLLKSIVGEKSPDELQCNIDLMPKDRGIIGNGSQPVPTAESL